MGGADFCKFSHAFRHGLLLSERILQISPGKNDNLPLMATTSTVWGSGSIGLSLVAQSRPPQISLLCGFCPLAREFALRRTFQPPQSDFLQIPPRDGHPCLWLTVPATESVVDFHHQVVDHAGRTQQSTPDDRSGVFLCFLGADPHPGIFMLMFSKLASQPSANTPMCAPSIEWVMREESAL